MDSLLARARCGAVRRPAIAAATPAERTLWAALRKRRLDGLEFRRRQAFGPFVLGFHCAKAALAIELDDSPPDDPSTRARDAVLAAAGLRVLRFNEGSVAGELAAIVATIRAAARQRVAAPPTGPSPASSGAGPGR